MMLIKALAPAICLALAVIASVVPWGLSGWEYVLPLLPFLMIHVLTVRQGAAMPLWLAFAAGLGLDALTQGPLGLWALVYLVGAAMAASGAEAALSKRLLGRWAQFAVVMAVLVALQWAVFSIYFVRLFNYRPLLEAGAIAAVIYPLIDCVVGLLCGVAVKAVAHAPQREG